MHLPHAHPDWHFPCDLPAITFGDHPPPHPRRITMFDSFPLPGRLKFGLRYSAFFFAAVALAATEPATVDTARTLYHTRGKSAEAQAAFAAIAAADPKNHPAQLHLGLLALRRDDTEAAIAHLERAVALAPDDGDSHKALGDAYGRSAQKASIFKQLGFAKKCLASYERAVALGPDRVEFHQCLFEYYRQAPGFVGGGRDKAIAEATAIKQLDPLAGRQAFATLFVSEKKYAEAFAQFDEVLATSPDDYRAHYEIGRLAALTGHSIDRGIASLRRCLELRPPPAPGTPTHVHVHWRLGTLLEKKSDPAAARAAYEAALALDPTFAPAAESVKRLR